MADDLLALEHGSARADGAPDAGAVRGAAVPEAPAVRLRPPGGWVSLGLRDLWAYRELFYFLTWRDVKVRYKQTGLGIAWAVLQPVLTMLVFTVFFGRVAEMQTPGVPYAIFVFAGLVPWTFFQNAVTNSANSLVGSSSLVSKVYFPRLIIPGAAVGAALVDFAISFVVLAILMVWFQVPLGPGLLLVPVLVVLTMIIAGGVGLLASALNVRYRDVRYALPFGIQLWMFISPVIYPVELLGEQWRWLLSLNPLTGLIVNYRAAILGTAYDLPGLAAGAAIAIVLLVWGAYSFRRMEAEFADVI